tara:strand:+ start:165 stop:497 length:333 start_codon:yes stop_codon:yes gene_type:complete
MCDKFGSDPNDDEMPPAMGDYPYEVQVAFFIHDILPDRWEGMSGHYMGKDMSSLGTVMDIYDVEDRRTTLYFLKHIEMKNANQINEKNERARKSKSTAKGGGINSADIPR